jgi:very-short-patch-repair endonuclease
MSPRYHYDLDAVHVCVKDASQRSHRQAATAHLWNHEFSAEAVAGKLFTVPPPTAWAQMAPYVALEDLVALGDSMMRHDPLLHSSTHHEFEEFLAKTGGFPGRRSCIEALKYMSENTDSIQESLLRFAIRQRGFDQPVSNFRVVDAEFAQSFLLDMAWPESKVGAEYNGPQHEGTAQRQRDEYKLSRLDQLGWRIATAKSTTLTNPIHMDMFITELLACFSQATRK